MSIHQEIIFNASVQQVFAALTDAEQFAALTGVAAQIDPQAGGYFSCFDGMITGRTIEIMPLNRLVQAWRVGNWASGVYSIVKFELEEISEKSSRVVFDHSGFPEEHKAHLEQGWHNKYWQPMKKFLER